MSSTKPGFSSQEPVVDGTSPELKTYYMSQESWMVYEVILRGTHHFGYYDRDTLWPFPIGPSLRRMEEKVMGLLSLPAGSRILDAGCGFGHVARYMAQHGMYMTAIDIIDHHVTKARQNCALAGLSEEQLNVQKMDFHHLERIPSESHDGVYTLQSLGHATDANAATAGFFRILKPGGRIAVVEVERRRAQGEKDGTDELTKHLRLVNEHTVMPTNESSYYGFYKETLEKAGFVDVQVRDWQENIRPHLRLFYSVVIVPWFFIKLFGLERFFTNMICATSGYDGQPRWRFVAISATKP